MDWQLLIKDIRKKLSLSQEDFAKKINVSFCTINRYENGHFEPTYKIQRAIKKIAIKIKIDYEKYEK